jgi:hypothetical protein
MQATNNGSIKSSCGLRFILFAQMEILRCLIIHLVMLSTYISIYLSAYLWLYSPLLDLGLLFQFLKPVRSR